MSTHELDPSFDPESGAYELTIDWQRVEDLGILVVEAVASVLRRDVLELRPLQEVVDVDSLETMLRGPAEHGLVLQFEYEDAVVELSRTGDVAIEIP